MIKPSECRIALSLLAGCLPFLVAGVSAAAQEPGPGEEEWPTILVIAPESESRALPPQLTLPPEWLIDRQPRSAADVLRGVPGVSVRTNSRGETIARIRGADERQTQVFLDGAPLAVPWDGRVDLGLLPAGILGGVRVVKGAAPIEYGANAVAGAVDFQTRQVAQGHFAQIEAGNVGSGSASLVLAERVGGLDMVLAAGGITRDGEPLAGPLPFNQPPDAPRTNTDLDAGSLFGALGGETGDLTVRASLLHLAATRGIAPEGDRADGVRYWRYPDIALTQATLNAELALGEESAVKLTAWQQWFGQRIEQYRSIDYAALRGEQEDEDETSGARLTLAHPAGPLTLRWAASAQTSTHEQVDTAFPVGETGFPAGETGPRLRFRQNLVSLGLEADAPLGEGVRLTLGGGYDRAETPLTGDKPAQPAFDAAAFSAALGFDLGDDMALTLSAGRRNRFPSARELFGEALGRFAINTDLSPEQAWLIDAEWRWQRPGSGWRVVLNPFLIRSDDTLSQRVLPDGRRQRINLSGATSFGVDGLVTRDLTRTLRLEFAGTLLEARADEGIAPFRRLPQRPSFEALAVIDWNLPGRFDVRAELRAVGSAIDQGPDGEIVDLPAAAELALRGAVPLARIGENRIWLTLAIDNLTQAQIFPQAGLPLPGRLWRIGLRLD
ncbi:MAG: TonB-dependent receptor [Erythrobacter sp.]|nr:TonB-dependent receptor [Erythrobacter sp.]